MKPKTAVLIGVDTDFTPALKLRPPGGIHPATMSTTPQDTIEIIPNPAPNRDYLVRFECPEFTCVCPKTGQPDFATLRMKLVPDASLVELKSLKLYLWSFRDVGAYHEAVTNQILDHLAAKLAPKFLEIEADFYVRGGIHTVVVARHGALPDALR